MFHMSNFECFILMNSPSFRREKGDVARDASDYDSEEENEDGDLTVYECPGLAPVSEL